MDTRELERIARIVLRELGAGDPPVTVSPDPQPDRWRIDVGGQNPVTLTVRAGAGTTTQYIREQIFTQFAGRNY
jgi:hypothetical protein